MVEGAINSAASTTNSNIQHTPPQFQVQNSDHVVERCTILGVSFKVT